MLLAVHIADGVLAAPWLAGGFAVAAVLALYGGWRLADEDIPRVAVLTAVFFVASLLHVPVGGVTSVHLLLNGLIGVVLGRRAALAIPVALALQALLLQHGGITALGVNSCVMTLPALLSWQIFRRMGGMPWRTSAPLRTAVIGVSAFTWTLSLIYSIVLLAGNRGRTFSTLDLGAADRAVLQPLVLGAAFAFALLAAWMERRLQSAPEFPLGLLIGQTAVMATVLLQALTLILGGQEDWPSLMLLTLIPHLGVAAIEGIVVGFTVGFLVRVKPELLARPIGDVHCTAGPTT